MKFRKTIVDRKLREQIEKLHKKFQADAPDKVEELITIYDNLNSTTEWRTDKIGELCNLLHKLAGSAGTLGLGQLGLSADKALTLSNKILQDNDPNLGDWVEIGIKINAMSSLLDELDEVSSVNELEKIRPLSEKKLIYVVDDESSVAEIIEIALKSEHYVVEVFLDTESFKQACLRNWPDVAILDMEFPDQRFGGGEVLAELRQITDQKLNSIVISKHDDMQSRLMAFRAGACKYLLKPLDIDKLIYLTGELCSVNLEEPYRVIIVDDVDYTRNTYSLTLQSIGIEVVSLSNPLDVLHTVRTFEPDVLVLDVYMPEATGPEVAAVLRQDDSLAWLSIMFLSVENDPVKQTSALEHGGDDFITKPVKPSMFVSSVKARAWRARRNRMLINNNKANEEPSTEE
jgi:DNA-binding response OmpR family regulator/HPt (histidine-containing phosphotransfer) domain-containing protein